jgi:hypothetical protein
MTFTMILISIALLTVLILIALKMALNRKEAGGDDSKGPTIHVSGVYSILRQSPREELASLRPGEEDISQYLTGLSEDINGISLDSASRAALLKHWKVQMEVNLREIETGDKNGAAFYYYEYTPHACSGCAPFIKKGNYVTREEIFNNPQIIPPFHLGCTCVLTAHHGNDNRMRETTMAGMAPFFQTETPPPLPEWTCTISLSATTGA